MNHRMYAARLAAALLGALFCLGGCTSLVVGGDVVMEHSVGAREYPGVASSDGQYALIAKFGDLGPMATVSLRQGDRLGFQSDSQGTVTAVAGEQQFPLEDGDYVWIRK